MELDAFNRLVDAMSDRWGHTEELLVAVCHLLDGLLRVTISANSKKRPKLPKPFDYPRPGAPVKKRNVIRPADLARRML